MLLKSVHNVPHQAQLRVICLGPLVGGHAADNWTIRIMSHPLMTSVSRITKPQAIIDYILVIMMFNLLYSHDSQRQY